MEIKVIEISLDELLRGKGVDVKEKPHCHKCMKCKTIWEHMRPPASATKEEFTKAHQCPRCGEEQRYIYNLMQDEEPCFPWKGE